MEVQRKRRTVREMTKQIEIIILLAWPAHLRGFLSFIRKRWQRGQQRGG